MTDPKLHHVLVTKAPYTAEGLVNLGQRLFQINLRSHGDDSDYYGWFEGRFYIRKDELTFYYKGPTGVYASENFTGAEFRVRTYLDFLD